MQALFQRVCGKAQGLTRTSYNLMCRIHLSHAPHVPHLLTYRMCRTQSHVPHSTHLSHATHVAHATHLRICAHLPTLYAQQQVHFEACADRGLELALKDLHNKELALKDLHNRHLALHSQHTLPLHPTPYALCPTPYALCPTP